MRVISGAVAGLLSATALLCVVGRVGGKGRPLVAVTWAFRGAAQEAWRRLSAGGKGLDAAVAGAAWCEDARCDGTVGRGGSPDEAGETTLDAMVFSGDEMDMGAVAGLRNVSRAVETARLVLRHTRHSVLCGRGAAAAFSSKLEDLSSPESRKAWRDWREAGCQPNFWRDVSPDPSKGCGPYTPIAHSDRRLPSTSPPWGHDTIGVVAIDRLGGVYAATSSNGATFKIPGRVGDAPLPGAGAYADSRVGAGLATGDGDVMMRFLPSFLVVEKMRDGWSPAKAAAEAVRRIAKFYPEFKGAVVAVSKEGEVGAACNNLPFFPYSSASATRPEVEVRYVNCTQPPK